MNDARAKAKATPPKTNHKQVAPEQVFLDAYNALRDEHSFEINAKPELVPRDDGSYSIFVRMSVVPIKRK